ncbi:MAG: hypothetical protein R2873_19425 [Caldilineaceae bacterium]
MLAIATGALIFWRRNQLRPLLAEGSVRHAGLFERTINGLYATARFSTRIIQDRSLSTHVLIVFSAAVAVLLAPLAPSTGTRTCIRQSRRWK